MSLFGIGKKEDSSSTQVAAFNPFKPEVSEITEKTKELSNQSTAITPSIASPSPTILDNILEDNDSQIKLGLAHDNALNLLNTAVALLATKLDDVKADKLPSVISAAGKTVESIRKERSEAAKHGVNKEVHYHFYTPQQKVVADYDIIEVGGTP